MVSQNYPTSSKSTGFAHYWSPVSEESFKITTTWTLTTKHIASKSFLRDYSSGRVGFDVIANNKTTIYDLIY
jgi:hypothetical protein